jgi:hypothetical protein
MAAIANPNIPTVEISKTIPLLFQLGSLPYNCIMLCLFCEVAQETFNEINARNRKPKKNIRIPTYDYLYFIRGTLIG